MFDCAESYPGDLFFFLESVIFSELHTVGKSAFSAFLAEIICCNLSLSRVCDKNKLQFDFFLNVCADCTRTLKLKKCFFFLAQCNMDAGKACGGSLLFPR